MIQQPQDAISTAPHYPAGTVAFLFTDIEGSTAHWERDAPAMKVAVEQHFALLRRSIAAEGGVLFKTIGDAVQAAFPSVPAAVRAAITAQDALSRAEFGAVGAVRVRMAIQVGDAAPVEGDYLAPALNRLARVLNAGYGEQVLLTEAAQVLAVVDLPDGYTLLDLGAHRLKDLLVAERIYQLAGPGLREQFPPLKSLDNRPHNLPAQTTELIGRQGELAHLRELLTSPNGRLVTLTGPGGTGKSRLAVQAAAELLEAFPDGVWWVPLAALTDPALVPAAIAAPLGVRELPGQTLLETLAEHLRSRKTLIVMDNLEQLLAAAPMIGRLMAAAAGLRVLTTSREPLRIRGERELAVEPLGLPPRSHLSPDDANAYPSVQLFVERAQAVKPGFLLVPENTAAVVEICRRLDGLPLAIELAAARVRLLQPVALLARLEQRLQFLTGGARDLPERQQTLRATIGWSHDLLDQSERTIFARLAVFSAGATYEAAAAVATFGPDGDIDVLVGIEGLVQKSLLRQISGPLDEPRFAMLETIREFALERLRALTVDEVRARDAHADYFRKFVQDATNAADQTSSYDAIETEAANIRGALDWLERQGDVESALECAADLRWFWWVRGHVREGQTRLEHLIKVNPAAPAMLRARALSGLGVLMEAASDYERARSIHEEALSIYRELGDEPGITEALENLGILAITEGDRERAAGLAEEVLTLRRADGDKRGIAVSLINLGNVASLQGDLDGALVHYEEARLLGQEADDRWILASSLGNIAGALIRQLHDNAGAGMASDGIEIDRNRAIDLLCEALRISQSLGDRERILDHLVTFAEAVAPRDPGRAAKLIGAAEALAAESGHQLASVDPGHLVAVVSSIRTDLGETAFLAARSAGERYTLDEAISGALLGTTSSDSG